MSNRHSVHLFSNLGSKLGFLSIIFCGIINTSKNCTFKLLLPDIRNPAFPKWAQLARFNQKGTNHSAFALFTDPQIFSSKGIPENNHLRAHRKDHCKLIRGLHLDPFLLQLNTRWSVIKFVLLLHSSCPHDSSLKPPKTETNPLGRNQYFRNRHA